eukprot:965855-Rhodomonas_salina.8
MVLGSRYILGSSSSSSTSEEDDAAGNRRRRVLDGHVQLVVCDLEARRRRVSRVGDDDVLAEGDRGEEECAVVGGGRRAPCASLLARLRERAGERGRARGFVLRDEQRRDLACGLAPLPRHRARHVVAQHAERLLDLRLRERRCDRRRARLELPRGVRGCQRVCPWQQHPPHQYRTQHVSRGARYLAVRP